jgi:hypothetical protein
LGAALPALLASRVIAPGSKLATPRSLMPETASSSLGRCGMSAPSKCARFMRRWRNWVRDRRVPSGSFRPHEMPAPSTID